MKENYDQNAETNKIFAVSDAALVARIVNVAPLFYKDGAIPSLDRPAHVRSGSGIARIGNRFIVIQDDVNFIALIDSVSRDVTAVTLPAGKKGKRQFDDTRGNKKFKMDLESCALISHKGEDLLISFGSGSNAFREKIVVLRNLFGEPRPEIYEATALYEYLRSVREFAGSEMNIEATVYLDNKIRLFNRGNGSAKDDLAPVNASGDLDWLALDAFLMGNQKEPPMLKNIVRYDLGNLDDLPLGFTDAAECDGRLFFSAAAEDSPDAETDGEVTGSVLGIFDGTNKIRWTQFIDADGKLFGGKIEGIVFSEHERERLFAVVDQDSPDLPTELCEVELSGNWFINR